MTDTVPLMYVFDLITRAYEGSRPAQILNGVPILECLCATPIAPPEYGENEIPCFGEDGIWVVKEDHRYKQNAIGEKISGTPYWLPEDDWSTQARYMKELGPLPADAILVQPTPPPPTIEELENQCRQLRKIQLNKTDRFLMIDTSLNSSEQDAVVEYRRILKDDIPLMDGYPWDGYGPIAKSMLPEVPDCIKDSIDK